MIRAARAAALALIAAALLAPGCGKKDAAGPAAGPPRELHLYTWADYVKPELVARFEKEQNARVVIDTFDSNEAMYAKLKAGATGYDLITPSSYMATVLHGQGLLQPIDHAKVANECITPLGCPVVPDVYMMVASSSPSRVGWPASGAVFAMRSSHDSNGPAGASGVAMQGRPGGTPARMVDQSSSLPRISTRASLCSRILRTEPAASVGYRGTETWPAIQIA